jgi:hypothetical protein
MLSNNWTLKAAQIYDWFFRGIIILAEQLIAFRHKIKYKSEEA